ncbi:MAG: hypothetical protein OJF51_002419 [Nitrospira sp.]|jgi:hypothetical protein|nr:MAG: hypothetical protein OJF51_002419 [Nitrospira sp.]
MSLSILDVPGLQQDGPSLGSLKTAEKGRQGGPDLRELQPTRSAGAAQSDRATVGTRLIYSGAGSRALKRGGLLSPSPSAEVEPKRLSKDHSQ